MTRTAWWCWLGVEVNLMKGSTLDQNVTRRHALGAVALAGVGAAVTACSSGTSTTTAGAPSAAATDAAATDAAAAAGGALTKTADIPVGGGVIFEAQKVVVVQPEAGTFKGYSATCTHQGCAVKSVKNGGIVCPCHNSIFAVADGSVTSGPAKTALPEVAIKVDGDSITLA